MSKNQTKKAFKERANYTLCSVDLTLYQGGDPLTVENIDDIAECMFFSMDIGEQVEHLIGILELESERDLINLDGDFRIRIPISYFTKGQSLDFFEKYLINFVQQKVDEISHVNEATV